LFLIRKKEIMTDKKILQTEIIRAAKGGDVAEMCILMGQGANPFGLDHDGKSAVSYISGVINSVQMKELTKETARFLYTNKM